MNQIPERLHCALTGVEITPLLKRNLVIVVESHTADRQKLVVVGHNLHSVYLYHTDPALRRCYDLAAIVLADGKPIEIDAKRSMAKQGAAVSLERLGSTDWILDFARTTSADKFAVIGASELSNAGFVEKLSAIRPDAEMLGISGLDWNDQSAKRVLEQLREARPQLVFLGLGMPRQEHFISDYFDMLPAATYVLVGGAIDQISGKQSLAPRWLGDLGLEWFWRLTSQPKRLAGRYLVEPWKLLAVRLKQRNR